MDSFSSLGPNDFFRIAENNELSEQTREQLKELGNTSRSLVDQISKRKINNNEISEGISSIIYDWQSLMKNQELSAVDRIELLSAVENILGRVRAVVTERHSAETKATREEGRGGLITRTFTGTAAAVAQFSSSAVGSTASSEDFSQNKILKWIDETKNSFLGPLGMVILASDRQDATLEDIVDLIAQWEEQAQATQIEIDGDTLDFSALKQVISLKIENREGNYEELRQLLTEPGNELSELGELMEALPEEATDKEVEGLLLSMVSAKGSVEFVVYKALLTVFKIDNEVREFSGMVSDKAKEVISNIILKSLYVCGRIGEKTADLALGLYLYADQKRNAIMERRDEIINSCLPANVIPGSPNLKSYLKSILGRVGDVVVDELQGNISVLVQEQNLKRFEKVLLRAVVNLVIALHGKKEMGADDVLRAIHAVELESSDQIGNGSPAINITDYKKGIQSRAVDRLALLVGSESLEQHRLIEREWKKKKIEGEVREQAVFLLEAPLSFDPKAPTSEELDVLYRSISLEGDTSVDDISTSSDLSIDRYRSNSASSESVGSETARSETATSRSTSSASTGKTKTNRLASSFFSGFFRTERDTYAKVNDVAVPVDPVRQKKSPGLFESMKSKLKVSAVGAVIRSSLEAKIKEIDDEILRGMEERTSSMSLSLSVSLSLMLGTEMLRPVIGKLRPEMLFRDMSAHPDVVFFYILDKVTQEIEMILTDPEKNIKELRQDSPSKKEVSPIRESVACLKESDNPEFNEALNSHEHTLKVLAFLLEGQKDPTSKFNLIGRQVESLVIEWQNWIRGI